MIGVRTPAGLFLESLKAGRGSYHVFLSEPDSQKSVCELQSPFNTVPDTESTSFM